MLNKFIYGVEVHVKGEEWKLRSDVYEEDELELAQKNVKFSRKTLPEDKFRIIKFKRICEVSADSSPP